MNTERKDLGEGDQKLHSRQILPFCWICCPFPGGSAGKESACNGRNLGLIPGLGRSPVKGNSYPLQYSGLEYSMDWMVHGVSKSRTERLWLSEAQIVTCSAPKVLMTWGRTLYIHAIARSSQSESESCSVMSDSLQLHGLYSPWNSPGQNTGVGTHSLLRGIFPTQGSNPGLPHCRFFTSWATREAHLSFYSSQMINDF